MNGASFNWSSLGMVISNSRRFKKGMVWGRTRVTWHREVVAALVQEKKVTR